MMALGFSSGNGTVVVVLMMKGVVVPDGERRMVFGT